MRLQEMPLEEITPKLYYYCLSLTKSKWLAEDLVQETILRYLKLYQQDPNRDINITFFYTIARNLFIDEKRKKRPLLVESQEILGKSIDFNEWDSLLEILYTKLPLRQAMLVTLKDVFQYTSDEIAQMLRVRNESIKTALHRARQRLKDRNHDTSMNLSSNESNIIQKFTMAVKNSDAEKIYYYYRLLETENYKVMTSRNLNRLTIFISDPDGNILQINSNS
jgi:RNA polymerase sigma factor (sigma-70 family)